MRTGRPILAIALLTVVATTAQGAGFQTYFEQSAAAMGQAAAVVARPDDPASLFFNPAAGAMLDGTQLSVTINGLMHATRYLSNPQDTEPSSTDARLASDPIAIPAGYVAHRLSDRWSLGLGLNTPYGAATDWGTDWSGRYYADHTNLKTIYAAPTLAYALSDRVSLGAALLAVWGEATIERAINAPLIYASAVPDYAAGYMSGAFSPANDLQTHLSGNDWAWGGRLGCHVRLSDHWAAGACYQSAVRLEMDGRATYAAPVYEDADFAHEPGSGATANQLAAALFPDTEIMTCLTLPPTVAAALAFAPAPQLVLEADLMWTGWSSYDSLTVNYASLAGEVNASAATPKLWEDTFTFRIGASYAVSERFTYRAGYAFDQSPIPNETRDPSLPGSDRHDLTTGIGYHLADWNFDLAYLYAMLADSPSQQNSALGGELVGGYEGAAHVVAAGVSRRFN